MIRLQEESLVCCKTRPLPPLSSMPNLRYQNYFEKYSAGLVHRNLVSPCRSFSYLLAELFSLFSPLNFLTDLRLRRLSFEYPGSAGAGPRHPTMAREQSPAFLRNSHGRLDFPVPTQEAS